MRNGSNDRILREISRRRRRREFNPIPLWILLGIIIIALITALFRIPSGKDKGALPDNTTEMPAAATPETERYPGYTRIVLAGEDIYRGDLILVNAQHAYVFPDDAEIVRIADSKTADYKLAVNTLELDARILGIFNDMLADFASTMDRRDVIINSGYRDFEGQKAIYDSRREAYGEEYAEAYVAHPGHSEHHTGYALDLAVYTDAGVSMTFDKDPDFSWFYDASHTYGFILRYAENKVDITGIASEPWHLRYVGKPHAWYLYAYDLCLEEYVELLRNYPFEGQHLSFRDDEEQGWEIYYVPATGERTEVYVPSDRTYTISGNNVDGYIVTVEK